MIRKEINEVRNDSSLVSEYYLQCINTHSNKFYLIRMYETAQHECFLEITYGRNGTNGRTYCRPMGLEDKVITERDTIIEEKYRKGYKTVSTYFRKTSKNEDKKSKGKDKKSKGSSKCKLANRIMDLDI